MSRPNRPHAATVAIVALTLACGAWVAHAATNARVAAKPGASGATTPTASVAPAPPPERKVDQVKMRGYVMGILRRGTTRPGMSASRLDSLRAGHMANIRRMFADHRLVCAGPFLDDGDLQGLYIFDADSVAQVRPWLDGDPFLATGHMVCDLLPWYGPAGISEGYRKAAAADPSLADSLERYTFGLLVRGPAWTPGDTPEVRDLVSRHLANIGRMAQAGQLALAGPFMDDGVRRGIYVFFTADTAEARRWSDTDPAVISGRLRVELHPWMTGRGILPR